MRTPHLPPLSEYRARRIRLVRLAGLLVLAGLSFLFQAQVIAAAMNNDLRQLNVLSQRLVVSLKAGNAEAMSFRTDVVYYRESLRSIMLKNDATHKQAKSLLLDMVRMAALLQSAAECHTGRYITCPANLMRELDHQQNLLDSILQKQAAGT